MSGKLGDTEGSAASVPGIEGSDIGDSELIAGTTTTYPGTDLMEYHYTLPNGVQVNSGPFQTDKKREAIMGWLDGLRSMIVSSAREAQDEAIRVQRAKQLTTEPVETPVATRGISPAKPADAPALLAPADNPDDFAKRSLAAAQAELSYWEKEAIRVSIAKDEAQSKVVKWTRVANALEA